ncbi:hypothetical protein SESBI_34656, partial [Sesbania bispinosa]
MAKRLAKKAAVAAKNQVPSEEASGKASDLKFEIPKSKRAKIHVDPSSHQVPHSGAQGTSSTSNLKGKAEAEFFLALLPTSSCSLRLKNNFHEVATKLQNDEVKMNEAIAQVTALTEERDKLNASNILQQQQLVTEKAENLQVVAEIKRVSEDLVAEIERHKQREKELEGEIEKLGKLWKESSEVYFHAAIKQIKYLNPGVELKSR